MEATNENIDVKKAVQDARKSVTEPTEEKAFVTGDNATGTVEDKKDE